VSGLEWMGVCEQRGSNTRVVVVRTWEVLSARHRPWVGIRLEGSKFKSTYCGRRHGRMPNIERNNSAKPSSRLAPLPLYPLLGTSCIRNPMSADPANSLFGPLSPPLRSARSSQQPDDRSSAGFGTHVFSLVQTPGISSFGLLPAPKLMLRFQSVPQMPALPKNPLLDRWQEGPLTYPTFAV